MAHALLGIPDDNALSGHPVVGARWEGFVIENLIAAAPDRTVGSFYRTSAGAEIDLVLDIPGRGLWVIDITRGLSARPEKGFHMARGDLRPAKSFLVNSGNDRYSRKPPRKPRAPVDRWRGRRRTAALTSHV